MATAVRPSISAASAVPPEPQKGSSTTSPGRVADVLADGVVGLFAPVGVHVVDSRRFGGGDRLVEGRDAVIVAGRVVGRGVVGDELAQVGVGAGGVVPGRHLRDGLLGEEGGLVGWFVHLVSFSQNSLSKSRHQPKWPAMQ